MSGELRFDPQRNLITHGAHRIVFHCHHYNLALQRVVDDALGTEAVKIQRAAASAAAYALFSDAFASDGSAPLGARLRRAADLFGSLGFGKADVGAIDDAGGKLVLETSHYALGHNTKFGAARNPVCHFAVGYWAGALSAATGRAREHFSGVELACAAVGDPSCVIRIEVA